MLSEHFSYDQFCSHFPVSRETYQKLESYVSMIVKWQKSVNLVSNATLPHIWNRHIVDSYQLVSLCPAGVPVVDLGSGAGLPGIVLAIAGRSVRLVESDGKKAAFLREAGRVLDLDVSVENQRVEAITLPQNATITARAFARISLMLALLQSFLTPLHKLVLPKGKTFQAELDEAAAGFAFDVQQIPSVSDAQGTIVCLSNIHPRRAA